MDFELTKLALTQAYQYNSVEFACGFFAGIYHVGKYYNLLTQEQLDELNDLDDSLKEEHKYDDMDE